MKIENLLKTIQVLRFIKETPECVVPDIRDNLGIIHSNPPSQVEKDLYKIISTLSNRDYVKKLPIENRKLGGPHFSLTLTTLGISNFNQLGLSADIIPSSEKEKIIKDLETELRLIIRRTLKGKISKPQTIEVLPKLTDELINGLNSFLEGFHLIQTK